MLRKSLVVVLVLAVGIWAYLQKPSPTLPKQSFVTRVTRLMTKPQESKSEVKAESTALEKKLHQEASLIARIDSAPENTEERLQVWARSLSADDLKQLEKKALDISQPQDDRFLAVMLMGWSEKVEALDSLEDIALSEIDPFLSPNRMGDFERVLRMQAVDGMLDLPQGPNTVQALQKIASNTTETSTADRANRALWAQRGDAPAPKEQDKTALEQLLKKPKRN